MKDIYAFAEESNKKAKKRSNYLKIRNLSFFFHGRSLDKYYRYVIFIFEGNVQKQKKSNNLSLRRLYAM
jgi:hypothetical protein